MTPATYLTVGALLAAFAAAGARWREKTLITPGTLLLAFYAVHCFLDPTLRYLGVHPRSFDPVTWETLTVYNALCYGALVVGYLLPGWPLHRDKRRYLAAGPARMFGRTGFLCAATACAVVLGSLFVGMAVLGRFSLPTNVFNAYRPPAYEQLVSLLPVVYILVPAVVVSALFDAGGGRRGRRLAAGALTAAAVVYTMATLGRGIAFAVLLTIGIVWHFRYRKLGMRRLAVAGLVVALVAGVALLRRTGAGLTGIDLEAVRQLAATGGLTFMDGFFAYTVMISEGQIVLSNTIAFVEETGTYGGRTYLDSVLSRTVPWYEPRLLQPIEWYRTLFIGIVRLGRSSPDFSILAEAYMNFGRAGWVVFLFVGALARWLSNKVYTARSPVLLLWSASMIVALIVATRFDSLALFMRATWYFAPLIALRAGASWLDASARRFRDGNRRGRRSSPSALV